VNGRAEFFLPEGSGRVRRVDSFAALAATPLAGGVNALCLPRTLTGDFAEVVAALGPSEEAMVVLDEDRLRGLALSDAGRAAVEFMLADLQRLRDLELDPVLNCIYGYPHDDEPGPVKTDVYSYHADSAPVPADTWLCTYHGPASEGLLNEEALRRIDVPATRAELLKLYGGADDAGFREFLAEHCYDLHYAPKPGARPYGFGLGNFWRIATDWPGNPVPPCIHRAPETGAGDPPRLLVIC
jgi:hypothetical protein